MTKAPLFNLKIHWMEQVISFKLPIDEIIYRLKGGLLASYSKGQNNTAPAQHELLDEFLRFVYLVVVNGPLQALEKISRPDGSINLPGNEDSFLDNGWDLIGPYWPAIETPTNYGLTMMAFLHFIKQEKVRTGTWLSLGSGPGIYETYLARRFPQTHITSLDIAKSMADFHENLKLRYAKNQTTLCQSIEMLPQKDQSCDLVICNNSIQWLERNGIKKTVSEIQRVLKKGGHLFLVVHPHAMQLQATGEQVDISIQRDMKTTGDEVFELFKAAKLTAMTKRTLAGSNTGQLGSHTYRVFFHFKK